MKLITTCRHFLSGSLKGTKTPQQPRKTRPQLMVSIRTCVPRHAHAQTLWPSALRPFGRCDVQWLFQTDGPMRLLLTTCQPLCFASCPARVASSWVVLRCRLQEVGIDGVGGQMPCFALPQAHAKRTKRLAQRGGIVLFKHWNCAWMLIYSLPPQSG